MLKNNKKLEKNDAQSYDDEEIEELTEIEDLEEIKDQHNMESEEIAEKTEDLEEPQIEVEKENQNQSCVDVESVSKEKYMSLYNQFMRLNADFENYKRRNANLASTMYNDGVNEVICAILPTLDSLDMAIAAQSDNSNKKGIELVKKAFMDVLAKYEVEEIKSLGEEFDPNFHEAVMNKDDPKNAGKIVQVLRAGYKRGDKILRHTMCVVGQ